MLRSRMRVAAVLVALVVAWCGVAILKDGSGYPSSRAFQSREDVWFDLSPQHSAEQTFVFDERYFGSLKFFVYVAQGAQSSAPSIAASVYRSGGSVPLAQSTFRLRRSSGTQAVELAFPAQANSANQKYVLRIETGDPPGVIRIWGSSYDDYREGDLTIDAYRTASDLAFFTYAYPPVLSLGSRLTFDRAKNVMFTLVVLACLGYGLNLMLRTRVCESYPFGEKSIWFALLGLVPFPILLSILSLLHVRVRPSAIQATMVALAIVFATMLASRIVKPPSERAARVDGRHGESLFVFLLVLAFVVRLMQISGLLVPNWTDGLKHTMTLLPIVQGGLLPTDQIYHMGFHENAFLFESLLGTPAPETILVFGQALSLLSGCALYLLARRLFPEGRVALWSATFYLFLSTFPAYLVSWGRYPYLTGLTLLPIGLLTILAYFENRTAGNLMVAAVVGSGILLCHYAAFAFWALFLISLAINRTSSLRPSRLALIILVLLITPVLVLILVSPQVASTVLAGDRRSAFLDQVRGGYLVFDPEWRYILGLTLAGSHWIIYAMGLLGGIFGIMMKDRRIALLTIWAAVAMIFSFAQQMTLGVALPSRIDVIIFASIPLCLLSGYAANAAWSDLVAPHRHLARLLAGCLLIVLLRGAYNAVQIVSPVSILFRQDDQMAMRWISTYTKSEEKFLIDSFAGGPTYIPADSGGWIYPLTGRRTWYSSKPLSPKGLLAFVQKHQINYIYRGAKETGKDLSQVILANPDRFMRVCCSSGVDIYRVLPATYPAFYGRDK